MDNTTLNPKQRAALRKILIRAGQPTRGLTDIDLLTAERALSTSTANISEAEIIEVTPSAPTVPPVPTNGVAQAISEAIQAALAASEPAPQAIDENAVRAIVRDLMTPTTTIKVVQLDDTAITIDGAHHVLPRVIDAISRGLHVYLVGPAGSGKTYLIHQAAKALNRESRVVGALSTKFELTGYMTATGEYISSAFRYCFEYGHVFGWDEIDASNPAALVAFNNAMANGTYEFPDGEVIKHDNFVAIAAANTFGLGANRTYVGRNPLDAATLDRYVQIEMDYDLTLEDRLTREAFAECGGTDVDTVSEWIGTARAFRGKCNERKINVVISPRALMFGARLLTADSWTYEQVLESTLYKHLSDDQRSQLGV